MSREVGEKRGVRILALGDSLTLGMGVVRDRDTWPMQLEKMINEGRTGTVEVINASAQGWNLLRLNSEGQLQPAELGAFLEDEGMALSPDMVIYCICLNDVPAQVDELFYMDNYENRRRFSIIPDRYRELFKRKAFYRLARDWYRERRFFDLDFSSYPMTEDPAIWLAAEAELKRLAEAARQRGIPFYAVVVPYSFQLLTANRDLLKINERWYSALAAAGIPYTDISDVLNETNVLSYYVLGDYIHMSRKGHALIAQRALEIITSDGALGDGPAGGTTSN